MPQDHTVVAEDDDIRLDRWFKRHYPGLPHALLEKQMRKGAIRVDGKKAKSSDRIVSGQVISCPEMENAERTKTSYAISPQDAAEVKRWVLYEDDRLIVVNKPAGLATQGGSKITKSLDDMIVALSGLDGKPKLTHRLDRDTSGVLVLAKNARVATTLMKFFTERSMNKTYLALVNNVPDPLKGIIDKPLMKKTNPLFESERAPGGPDGRDYEIVSVVEGGQKAITEYHVLDFLARRFAFVEMKPQTGRLHQLRVHMSAIGCPIVGDHKYGGGMRDALSLGVEDRLHLHARRIVIPAFASKKAVDVSAPLPAHMKKSFKALGLDIPKD